MVIRDTINTDKYLYIKKLLCMLSLSRLQKCIKINDEEYDEEDFKKELLDELSSLNNNLTIPSFTIRTNSSYINLEDIFNATIDVIEAPDSTNKDSDFWIHKKKTTQITDKDIYELPNKELAFNELFRDYQSRTAPYDNVRSYVIKIINNIDYMLSNITSFVTNKDTFVNLSLAIFYMNTIEFLDWVFSLSEFGESIFSEYDIPEHLLKDNEDYD